MFWKKLKKNIFYFFLRILLLQNFFLKIKIYFLRIIRVNLFYLALNFKNKKIAYFFNWEFLEISRVYLEINLFLDFFSLLFGARVLTIAARVFRFSESYMKIENYFSRFHWIVFLFVISILILIFSSNLALLLLGWDGLGVVSYLLVIFFFSRKSINAGLLTVLTNRIGDVLILLRLGLYLFMGRWNIWIHILDKSLFLRSPFCLILILARITKRAQIPFSAWLPAAIAAPTPVSALVHSSTLVTAGVYLIIRFFPLIKLRIFLNFVFIRGAITLLIAGVRALFEVDIKKIVALSTLSQLGLICCRLGAGLLKGAFFHLLTHAFFKALLFIRVGNMIHLSDDYQDLRKINLRFSKTGFTFAFSAIANWRLIGIPFLSGFFSKDFILEIFFINSFISIFRVLIFYIGCILTTIYSFRFIVLINWNFIKIRKRIIMKLDLDLKILKSIGDLLIFAIFIGRILRWVIFESPRNIFIEIKLKIILRIIVPRGILIRLFMFFLRFRKQNPSPLEWRLGILWGLPLFSRNFLFKEFKLLSLKSSQLLDQTINKNFLFVRWKNYEIYSLILKKIKDNTFLKNFFFLSVFFFWFILV